MHCSAPSAARRPPEEPSSRVVGQQKDRSDIPAKNKDRSCNQHPEEDAEQPILGTDIRDYRVF